MAQPVLVKAYTDSRPGTARGIAPEHPSRIQVLPPISSFAFDDIFRAADCPELQDAIEGIAEICAKNRMSLADEYASHLPPLGEITATTSSRMRPHMHRPAGGLRRALTSVPEGSSGSSEGSSKSKKKGSIFGFRKHVQLQMHDSKPMRKVRISSTGRTITVGTTTAMAAEHDWPAPAPEHLGNFSEMTIKARALLRPISRSRSRIPSAAESSLRRLLATSRTISPG